jgi:hypothetical protein
MIKRRISIKKKYAFVTLNIGLLFCFLTELAFTSEQTLSIESSVSLNIIEHNTDSTYEENKNLSIDVTLSLQKDEQFSPEKLYDQAQILKKKGGRPNLEEALKLYLESANLGCVKAQTEVADLYMFDSIFSFQNVIVISKDDGIHYLKMAANQGGIDAINTLINDNNINAEEAINCLKLAAARGKITETVTTLLNKKEYLLNENVKNRDDAVPIFKSAAEKGNIKAIVQLSESRSISKDEKISLLKRTADHNENNRDAASAELKKMGIFYKPSPTELNQQNPKQEDKKTCAKYNKTNETTNQKTVLDAEYTDQFVSISSSVSSSPDTLKRKEPSSSTTLQDNVGKKPRYELEQQNENHELCKVTHIQGYENHKNLLKEMIKKATRFIYISSYSANFVYDELLEQAAKRICENKQYEEKDKGIFIDITLSPCDMQYPRSDKIQRIQYKIQAIKNKYQNIDLIGNNDNHAKLVIIDDLHFIIGSHNWLVFDDNHSENNDCSIHISHNENSKTNHVMTLKESYFKKKPITLPIDNNTHLEMLYTAENHEESLYNICLCATTKIEIYSPFVDDKWDNYDKLKFNLCNLRLSLIYNAFKNNNKKPKLYIYVQNESDQNLLLLYASTWGFFDKTIEIRVVNPFHRKTIIVDNNIICEGSFNWFSSTNYNLEASIVIRGSRAQEIINSLI